MTSREKRARRATLLTLAAAAGAAGLVVTSRAQEPPPSEAVVTLAFDAVADTYVAKDAQNRPHGSEAVLAVEQAPRRRALVRFDLAAVGAWLAPDRLESAELELTIAGEVSLPPAGKQATLPLGAHRLTPAWSEAEATWTRPAAGRTWSMDKAPLPFAEAPTTTLSLARGQRGVVRLDVTRDVAAVLAGEEGGEARDHGWILRCLDEAGPGAVRFASREGGPGPRLVVRLRDVTPPSLVIDTPVEDAWTGPADQVRVTFADPRTGIAAGSFAARVGGIDVTGHFEVGPDGATAPLAALAAALAQGPNQLACEVRDVAGNLASAEVGFRFDSIGPAVALTPPPGVVVTTDTVSVRVTYEDLGAGVDLATVTASLDGEPLALEVGAAEATAVVTLGHGEHTLTAEVRDLVGNPTVASSTFRVVLFGTLEGVVGGARAEDARMITPLPGVRVRALTPEAPEVVTDHQGNFTLPGVRAGQPVVLLADGGAQGFGRAYMTVEAVADRSVPVDRSVILHELPAEQVPLALDADGRTTQQLVLTNPDIPGLSLTIDAGSRVVLPDDLAPGATPALSITRLAWAATPNPLASDLYASWWVMAHPVGAQVVEGFGLTLPNDLGLPPGAEVTLQQFDHRTGAFFPKTTLRVSGDGSRLEGRFNSDLLNGAAAVAGGPPMTVSFNVDLTASGSVSTLFAQLNGASAGLYPTATPGVYVFTGTQPTNPTGSTPSTPVITLTRSPTFPTTIQPVPTTPPPGTTTNTIGSVPLICEVWPQAIGPGQTLHVRVAGAPHYHELVAHVGNQSAPLSHLATQGDVYLFRSPADAPLPEGSYVLEWQQVSPFRDDKLWFSGAPPANRLALDRTAPAISTLSFPEGVTTQPQATLQLVTGDAVAGIRSVEVQGLSGSTFVTVAGPFFFGDAGTFGPTNVTLNQPLPLTTGTNRFRAVVVDTVGITRVRETTVVLDTVPPVFLATSFPPTVTRLAQLPFSTQVTDEHSLVDQVSLLRDGVVAQTSTSPGKTVTPQFTEIVPDGRYTYSFRAVDSAGNVAHSASQEVVVDRAAPTITDVSAVKSADDAFTITFTVTEVGPAGLAGYEIERFRFGVPGGTVAADALSGFGPVTITLTDADRPDGDYSYRIRAIDQAENEQVVTVDAGKVDQSPPTIHVGDLSGGVFGPGVRTGTFVVEDNFDPEHLSVFLDGAAPTLTITREQVAVDLVRTTISFSILKLVEGQHDIQVSATDPGGNTTTASGTFTVDLTAPEVTQVEPASGLSSTPTIEFSADHEDILSEIVPDSTTLVLASDPIDLTAIALRTPTRTSATVTGVPDGQHTFILRLTDRAGNVTEHRHPVLVDTRPPQVTVTQAPAPAPAWTRDPRAPLRATFHDDGGSGVAEVRLLLDGVDVTDEAILSATSLTFAPDTLTNAAHEYRLEVLDRAGHVTTVSLPFQVDATPPSAPGRPLAGARPLAATTVVRWLPSVDAGPAGVVLYHLFRSEDGGDTFQLAATTAATEATVAFPTGEKTVFRLVAVDAAGNVSAAVDAKGCEVVALHELTTAVSTVLQVRVQRSDGSPISDALVTETGGTGAVLGHVGDGLYRSNTLTVPSGQPLYLQISADGTAFVSGPLLPLLPETTETDFGLVVLARHRLAQHVFAAGGQSGGQSGGPLGFTLGEAGAFGPPPATSGGFELSGGFWHGVDLEGEVVVHVLQTPPVICAPYLPLTFEVVADGGAFDVTVEFSTNAGATFAPATIVAGATQALAGTPVGRRYMAIWHADADLGDLSLADVVVRVSPVGRPERGGRIGATLVRSFKVLAVEPRAGTRDLDPQGELALTFSRPVTNDPANLAASIVLEDVVAGTSEPVDLFASGTPLGVTVRVVPRSALAPDREYRLRVLPGLRPATGQFVFDQHALVLGLSAFEAAYRTGGLDARAPRLLSSVPAHRASGVHIGQTVFLFFDEELDPASVTDRTIVVTSATGVVPAPVSLLADGRTVAVSPSLQPGRCYTVSVGRGVRDLAGNALADFAHVTFTTLTSQLTPPAPTITSPTSGAVLSDPRPVITGLAAPRYEVHLFVNGFPTGLRAVARDDGTFELTPFALPDGDVSLFAVTAWPGGSPASGPGAPVSFRIETERLPASTPPAPGATDVHEVLAGALEEPAHRYELRFSGAPGAPFVLDVETLRRSQGLFAPIELRVAPENGGGTFSVAAGRQTLGAGSNTFDASGEARVTYRANDVVKDGARLRLVNPLDQTATEPQEVVQRSPIAFVSVGASPPFAGPTRASVALRARLLRSPETAILAGSGYPVRVRAVDENGEPTDAVAIEGQPGSSGATAVTDENGNVTVTFVHQDGEAPFALVVESGASFDCPPFDRLQPTRLGESGIFVPTGGESGPGGVFLSTRNDPVNNPSVGADNTLAVSRGCPPDPPPGPPPPPARTQPINVDHGGKLEARVDIVLPGRGVHFAWTRSYKGYGLYAGPLGHRWTHGFDQRLLRQPSGDVQWVTGTARTETFRSLGGGRFATPRGFDVVLSVDAQGVGTLRDPSGGKAVFRAFGAVNAPGALAEVRDAHGNRLVLEYGVTGAVAGRLIAVVDPLGRRVDLGYDLLGRIVTVTDHLGRQVRYRYSRLGDLIAATSPAVLATTEGELLPAADQFPEGRTEVYAYTSGFADERLNHQMLLRVAPVEAAKLPPGRLEDLSVLRPLACVENTYDLDPDSPSYGSVIKQRWGGESVLPAWTGETAPLAAGGTSTFRYEDLPLPPNASLNHPARKTTIVDRAGNLVELFHNRAGQCVRVRQYTNRNVRPGEPELFEATKVYNHAGLLIAHTLPSGSTTRWIHADEDLNGDGVLTPGEDRNGDGDFDDPEDVQPEDDPRYAYRPGNGVLDRRAPWQRLQLLRVVQEPDARGDTRGGVRPRIRTFEYDPVFGRLIRHTDPRGHDPDYTPQNGGPWSPERYTSHVRLDYQQGEPTATRAALAAELGTSEADLQALLDEAGVVLGLGDLNASPADDGHRFGDPVRAEAPSVRVAPGQTLMQAVYGPAQAVVALLETSPLGQPLRAVDPEGNVTLFHYHPEADPDGDGVPEPGVTSTVTTGGWLAEVIVDAVSAPGRNAGTNPPPVAARTRLFYDRAGNPTRVIDPRGVEHRTTYNVFNEPVSSRVATAIVGSSGGPVTEPGLAPLGYEARVTYDANGRPVEVRVSNAGERDGSATQVATNPWWTRKVAYDLLDGAVLTLAEVEPIADDASITVSSPGVVVSRVVYEPNRDVRLVVKPEGNVVHYVHDERSRLAYVTDGLGTPEQATTTLLVDVNGNLERIVSPVKRNPTKAPGYAGDVTLLRYNGFDEQICTHDPEGNCGDAVMDPLGQKVRFVRHGPNEENLPRLLEVEYHYDELGRLFRTDARVFEDLTQRFEKHGAAFRTIPTIDHAPPAGEEEAVTLVELDALGRALRGVDPKGDESLAVWDGAGRLLRALGPMFSSVAGAGAVRNEVRFTYNQAGQPVSATTFERSPLGLEQAFTATAAYDAVGRLFQATDPAGHTGRLLYDSRGNVIAASDAHSQVTVPNLPGLWPPTVNGHGNVARTFYDGLSRPVASEVLLKQGGVGDGSLDDTNLDTTNASNPDGKITITQRWDRNSRLVSRSDDNGNTTGWAYDARDRVVYTLGADLSVQRTLYDPDSLVRQTIDRNGTVIDRSYDAAGRLLKVEATRRATNLEGTGQAVEGTAVQAFEYDGLHRVRLAVDQNDPLDPTDDVATSFTYDSLGRQLTERHRFRAQTSLVSTFATQGRISVGAAGIDRTITRTFDLDSNRTSTTYSSGRTLTYQIDGLDRLQAIRDSVGTIAAMEFVGGRPLASTTGRGTVSTSYSYDLKRRLTGLDHVGPAGRVAGFAYAWDRSDRRASETHLPALGVAARTESYTYDSASRITRVAFGDARPDTSWVIDGVGNWVSRTEGGQTQTVNQRQNGKYAPDLMNEVSRLATFNALGSLVKDEQHTQDPNGNRIRSGEWRRSFDVFDRLVRVERTSDGATVGRYRYDALGRRVDRWFVARGEAVGQQAFHVNDGAQEVEEVDGAGNVVADYVWGGLYLDQVVQMRRGGQEYHLHANSIWSVVAATDASGVVVERYEYASIYGVCEVRNAAGAAKAASAEIGNPWRFQGRRFDPETGFYYFRLRYLDPEAGRFVSRDPLGIWGDAGNLGNGYAFAGNDPVNRVDPWGLEGDDSAAPSVFNAQKESPFPPVGYTLVDWSTGMVWYDKRRTQGTPIEHYEANGIPLPGNWDPDGPIPTIRRSKWFEHVYRHRRGQLPPEDPELMESRLRMLQLLGFAGVAFLPELFAVMRGGQILLRASMGGMAATRGAIYLQRTAITGTYRIMVRGLTTRTKDVVGQIGELTLTGRSLSLKVDLTGTGIPAGTGVVNEAISRGLQFASSQGVRVGTIEANWGLALPTNLNAFNAARQAGKSVEDAVFATPTGRAARAHGFGELVARPIVMLDESGKAWLVHVQFRKGCP